MACIPTDLLKMIVEKLMNLAIAEARYICCFTCIVEDFEKEKGKLKAKRATVGEYVEAAKGRAEGIRPDVTDWEKRADKLINEDTSTKMTCFFGWCPNCKGRYLRGKELEDMRKEITSLLQNNFEPDGVGLARRAPGVEYHSSLDYISFESRESKYKELLDALKDDNNYITGLQGMGGTGKTTLAMKVGKELKKLKFDQVVDTTVSYTPDIKKIQDDIARPLGLKWKDCSESERPKLLWSRLRNGEKILIILDDVWAPIDFEEIGIPYSGDHEGCRVLVTTRNVSVCVSMGCERERIIQLDLLPDEDAWTLFEKHAGISDRSTKRLLDKGKEIMKECQGLPVAIAAIASTLKGQQSPEKWDVTLTSLKKPMPMHGVDKNMTRFYKCLRYAYDDMKDEKTKKLFLLCSVFQEDEQIPTEILTRFGVGVGLFGEVDNYDEARKEVVVAKDELIDSCLLLKAEEGCVKMHDLVREAAHWIANKEIQVVKLSNKNLKSLVEREKNIRYLSCECKDTDVISCRFDGSSPKLEILIVCIDVDHDSVEVPDSFFENTTGLRVLHLSQKKPWRRPALSLRQSIESLTNIRSLILKGFHLDDISILGTVRSLETLDLLQCKIIELPLTITKLEKLILLNLDECEIERNPFEVIGRCLSLEEFYFNCRADKLIDSTEAIHQNIDLPKLQRYRLIDSWQHEINDSISNCVCLSKIHALFSETTFKCLVKRAEILRLDRIEVEWRNLILEIVPTDEGMNDLVELCLEDCSKIQCLIDTKHIYNSHVQNVFSKLVELELVRMDNLEELCNGPLPLNLCNLKTMKLYSCPKLVSLFQLSTSRSLVLLEKLEIYDCEQLENIITDERTGEEILEGDNDNKCRGSMFPNLKTLDIAECHRLEFILPFLSARDVPALEAIKINDCGELKYIVEGDNDNKSRGSMFPNLKTLDIAECHRLEFTLPFLSARDVPALKAIVIRDCGELRYIFGNYQHEHKDQDLHQKVKHVVFGSLEQMLLIKLPKFIDIFPECHLPMCSSVKRSSSRDGSKAQMQSDPIKCNIFHWTHICCYAHKYTQKLRSTTSTNIPLVPKDQLQDCSISSASNLECLHLWEHAQCLSKHSQVLRNIKEIELYKFSKIKSVFILCLAPKMLETLKIVDCDELKHIIIDVGDDHGGDKWGDVFQKLKMVLVKNCRQLEYIFGHYPYDHQNHNEIHFHLPALQCLNLGNLPNLISICPKNYRTTLPSLTEFELHHCSQFTIKSIGDLMVYLDSRQLDNTTTKELSGNVKHFLTLENLKLYYSKVENIFRLNETIGQPMNLGLKYIELCNLSQMMYLFEGPKNSVNLQNLRTLRIEGCEKLEVIFSAAILRCLPQLHHLWIIECEELKQIIEEDVENQQMSNILSPKTCFPKLSLLVVKKCNKLKCVFPVSASKELPKLEFLIIKEASELEEVFGREQGDQKVELPNLKLVVFVKLPSLCQGIELQTPIDCFAQNCPKLSMTSTFTHNDLDYVVGFNCGYEVFLSNWFSEDVLQDTVEELLKEYETEYTGNQNPTAETTEDFPVGPEVQVASGRELPSSQVNANQSMQGNLAEYNQHENGIESNEFISVETKNKRTPEAEKEFVEKDPGLEIPSTAISPTDSELNRSPLDIPLHKTQSHCLKETDDRSIQEGSPSEKTVTATLSTDSEAKNTSPGPLLAPLQKRMKRSVEEGTTSENPKIIMSSNHSESVSSSSGPLVTSERKTYPQEDGDGQIAMPSFSVVTAEHPTTKDVDARDPQETSEFVVALTETHAPVSLNDDASKKVSSIIEEQFSKDDDIGVSESKPSPSIHSPIPSQSPSLPMDVLKGNPSQIEEDSSIASLVTRELDQLVSKKHLAPENMSLLTDFLVKHPSVQLMDKALSHKYKGHAYDCLAELLKFLQTHSVLDVLGSRHSDFVELLQDVRSFGFDKDWLDGVERRAFFPGLQVSQDAFQKLLDSKQQATQEVEQLRLKIDTLKHQLASSEAVLESIIQQEAQVLEARAALSGPLGY